VAKIIIERERCKGCTLCVTACKLKNIEISDKFNKAGYHPAVFVDGKKCNGCGFCYLMCPEVCIEVEK